jgi:hypothetical protein
VCISLNFFLAQLAVLRNELKLVKERAAGGPNKEPAQIERPDKVTNLQAAMALMNDPGTYHQIRVIFFFSFLLSAF